MKENDSTYKPNTLTVSRRDAYMSCTLHQYNTTNVTEDRCSYHEAKTFSKIVQSYNNNNTHQNESQNDNLGSEKTFEKLSVLGFMMTCANVNPAARRLNKSVCQLPTLLL